ncbi:CBS domain-containing protein [Methanothermobacter wolfeii]|uniref:CBS domain-containing protein n=1 Tax=Methanothermobacter wolfeii TaxID=145261 RepID=UPI0024B3A216|nr:CBS domain-containing protein [Methanothermobacter wolfeii]MDI6701416.1 CBS domain-containing protein [Methanothermobacter wolfeii]MDI6842075.1 CBS domain-containing protein [Methanothermobacter wolfeii]
MIKVKDAMQSDVITVKRTNSIHEAARVLRENRISGAPVVDDDGKLVGIISEGDIMRLLEVHSPRLNLILPSPLDLVELPIRMKHEYDEIAKGIRKAAVMLVEEIMKGKVITVSPEASVSDAAELMDKHDIKRLPVVDEDGNLVGIITRGDVIGAFVK